MYLNLCYFKPFKCHRSKSIKTKLKTIIITSFSSEMLFHQKCIFRKKTFYLIIQYTLTLLYWPVESHDSLGLWRQSFTRNADIIFDIVKKFAKNFGDIDTFAIYGDRNKVFRTKMKKIVGVQNDIIFIWPVFSIVFIRSFALGSNEAKYYGVELSTLPKAMQQKFKKVIFGKFNFEIWSHLWRTFGDSGT